MIYNLMLYVPTLLSDVNASYGLFVQHHFMDDKDIKLSYYEFDKINPETCALDIVEHKPVTDKIRIDSLVQGFALKSYYAVDTDKGYNRSIAKRDVKQLFVCFKSENARAVDAFIRVSQEIMTDYYASNGLIIFKLWTAPEVAEFFADQGAMGHLNYTKFAYFQEKLEEQLNNHWRTVLDKQLAATLSSLKINSQGTTLSQPLDDGATLGAIDPSLEPSLADASPTNDNDNVIAAKVPDLPDVSAPDLPQTRVAETVAALPLQTTDKGSSALKVTAYVLLSLGILSMLIRLFG